MRCMALNNTEKLKLDHSGHTFVTLRLNLIKLYVYSDFMWKAYLYAGITL